MTKLKLFTNEGIRRVNIGDAQLTYDSLLYYGAKLFPLICQAQEVVIFSWIDDEGDEILVSSDFELREAVDVLKSMNRGHIKFKMMQVNRINVVGQKTSSSRESLLRELKNRSLFRERKNRNVCGNNTHDQITGARPTQPQIDDKTAVVKKLSAFFSKKISQPPHKVVSKSAPPPVLVSLRAKVVDESSIPPGFLVSQNEVCTIHKKWRLRNVGTEEWPAQTQLIAAGCGEGFPLCCPQLQLSSSATTLVDAVPVGGEVTIAVDLPVSRNSGPSSVPQLRTANFRLRTPSRCCFGDILSVRAEGCVVEPPIQKWSVEMTTLGSLGLVSKSNYGYVCNLLEQLVGNASVGSDAHQIGLEAVIMTLVVRRSLA